MAAGAGVFGPYERRGRWVVITRPVAGGAGTSRSFDSAREAARFAEDERAAVVALTKAGRTVGDAIDAYALHLEREGHKQRTETLRRVRLFFDGHLDEPLRAITPGRAAGLYRAVTQRRAQRWEGSGSKRRLVESDRLLSATSHRGVLTHAKTFGAWCVDARWLRANPLADVKPIGKLKHGKPQLRVDEARAWYTAAVELAPREAGALAALAALLLGMRASEITTRQVRDLDDGGRLLWIPESKTAAGRRTLEVPDVLRDGLRALAAGRAGDALLFGGIEDEGGAIRPHLRGWILHWTRRICQIAKVPRVSAHSLRGLHATLALQAGATSHVVAGALGHASDAVTLGSYAAPGSQQAARSRAALGVLDGGRKR